MRQHDTLRLTRRPRGEQHQRIVVGADVGDRQLRRYALGGEIRLIDQQDGPAGAGALAARAGKAFSWIVGGDHGRHAEGDDDPVDLGAGSGGVHDHGRGAHRPGGGQGGQEACVVAQADQHPVLRLHTGVGQVTGH